MHTCNIHEMRVHLDSVYVEALVEKGLNVKHISAGLILAQY